MSEEVAKELPADLKAYVETARAFTLTHNLLATGNFPHRLFQQVDQCIQFIKTLHAESLRVASEHPESDIFPELKAFKDQVKATEIKPESPLEVVPSEVSDGET